MHASESLRRCPSHHPSRPYTRYRSGSGRKGLLNVSTTSVRKLLLAGGLQSANVTPLSISKGHMSMNYSSIGLPPFHLRRPTFDTFTLAAKRNRDLNILHALGPFEKCTIAHSSRICPLARFQFQHRC